MSLLSLLEEGPAYGLALRNEFEERTGGIWDLNVGQVYTTLGRLARDGLVTMDEDDGSDAQKTYAITAAGRSLVREWFASASDARAPARDELVLKIVMAAARNDAARVIQRERKAALELLQQYARLKRDAPDDADLGWQFLLDSLIFQAEARVRWLDTCDERVKRARPKPKRPARARRRRDGLGQESPRSTVKGGRR